MKAPGFHPPLAIDRAMQDKLDMLSTQSLAFFLLLNLPSKAQTDRTSLCKQLT
jgi:hypothetical protein